MALKWALWVQIFGDHKDGICGTTRNLLYWGVN